MANICTALHRFVSDARLASLGLCALGLFNRFCLGSLWFSLVAFGKP